MAYNDDKARVKLFDGDSNPIGSVGDSLKVAITGTVSDTHVIVDNVNLTVSVAASDGDNVAVKDVTGTNALSISASGAAKVDGSAVTQPVSISTLPLPSGASTETTLSSLNSKVTAVNTGAVVISSSVLPSGASTEATLALIKAKTDNLDVALSTRTKPADVQTVSGTVSLSSLPASPFDTRNDTFTTTGNGTSVNASSDPKKYYTMVVKGTGTSAATWDVRLEGSLDNSNFSQILQHTNTTGDGAVLYIGASVAPAMYFRSRCAGLVLGGASNIVVTILGMN